MSIINCCCYNYCITKFYLQSQRQFMTISILLLNHSFFLYFVVEMVETPNVITHFSVLELLIFSVYPHYTSVGCFILMTFHLIFARLNKNGSLIHCSQMTNTYCCCSCSTSWFLLCLLDHHFLNYIASFLCLLVLFIG